MIYVIGSRGRLGRAICASSPTREIIALDRETYADWWQSDASAAIGRFFKGAASGSVVMVASGLLDPGLPAVEHRRVNVELPARVIEGASSAGVRVVTFGTVMERLVHHPNAYVASKAELGQLVERRAAAGYDILHVQLHTLYGGGLPAPFMFLGQLCDALREGRPFEMSPGRQLREYHHVVDDVGALHVLNQANLRGSMALTHGNPCTLRDLAASVFESLGCSDSLRIGARAEPPDDNYATVLKRPLALEGVEFRPSVAGVTDYVKAVVEGSANRR